MKKILKAITFSIIVISETQAVFSQSDTNIGTSSPCEVKYGTSPTNFEGQKCWLMYALSSKLYVYGNKSTTNGIYYSPDSIPLSVTNQFFNYLEGMTNYYLEPGYTAWGGNWYSCKEGGISKRFHGMGNYPLSTDLNWVRTKAMSKEDIFKLSPAEKMDVYLNDSSFSITKFELTHRGPERPDKSDDRFCGFCNGARIAGIILPEPKHSISLWSKGNNPSEVMFSVADIKALLSAAYMHPSFTFSFGLPSESNGSNNPNPGILDVMLRLYLGKYKIPFVVDDSYGPELYNETVMGYDRFLKTRKLTKTEKTDYPLAANAIDVDLTLYLQDELSFKRSELETISIMGDKEKAIKEKEPEAEHGTWVHKKYFKYTLFGNIDNVIVDGKWVGEPLDFMWAAHGDGNEDEHVKTNDTPGIPKADKNNKLDWYQVKFLLTKSLE